MERKKPPSARIVEPNLVSVLIPCHQHGHFLPQAVESVLRQTYPSIEIIIVNDGSTDNTHQIGIDYANCYPDRIIYLKQQCQGQAIARRNAAALARGEFWVTLDADDIIEADMVAKCVKSLQSSPQAAAAVSDVWIVDANGTTILDRLKQNKIPAWPDILNHNPLGGIAGIMLRAEAIEKVGGLAHEGLPGAEDWDLWIRLVRSRLSFMYLPDCLARYRQTPNSHSRKSLDVLLGTLQVIEKLKQDDPRLDQIQERYPPIDPQLYQSLHNQAVFFAYGIAIATQSDETLLRQILGYLIPGQLDTKVCAQKLMGGINKVLEQTALDPQHEIYQKALSYLDNYLISQNMDVISSDLISAIEAEQIRRRQVYQRWDRVLRKRLYNTLMTLRLNSTKWQVNRQA
jgi:hypothetical protein